MRLNYVTNTGLLLPAMDRDSTLTVVLQELKVRDDHYVKELKKESEAIDLMTDRMDEQVTQLATAGQAELSQIEVGTERGGTLPDRGRY